MWRLGGIREEFQRRYLSNTAEGRCRQQLEVDVGGCLKPLAVHALGLLARAKKRGLSGLVRVDFMIFITSNAWQLP